MAVVGDGHADHAGGVIHYTVVVDNTGNVSLHNVVVTAGTNGFADGEITSAVDFNHDGSITVAGKTGLLIGDYNENGLPDLGEDVLFISTADALTLLSASAKDALC